MSRSPLCSACSATALLLALWAAPAASAEGLYLTWGDCALNGAGTSLRTFACNTDVGDQALYCALVMPQATDSVLAIEMTVDVQVAATDLPDWWRYGFGGCREGMLVADLDFAPLTTCGSVLPSGASGGLLSYVVGMPRGGAAQARLRIGFSVPSSQPMTLNGTTMYYAARITFPNTGATGGCSGCGDPACLVLNSILVRRPPRPVGTPTTDVLLTTPGPGNGNWASWQMTSAATCQAVPVRNRTWGEIKSLYR
jgi:hypothetical protein